MQGTIAISIRHVSTLGVAIVSYEKIYALGLFVASAMLCTRAVMHRRTFVVSGILWPVYTRELMAE